MIQVFVIPFLQGYIEGYNTLKIANLSEQVKQPNIKKEVAGLLEAMNQLSLSEGTSITFDQGDKVVKEWETIRLIPVWQWLAGSG